MLFFILIVATLASTFMVSDTLSHVSELKALNVSSVLLGLWMTAFVLAFLDSHWFNLLSLVHVVMILACSFVAYQRDPAYFFTRDYIRFPLCVFVPIFVILYMLSD